jgi:hypothetical protein
MVVGRIKVTGYRASPRSDFKETNPFQSPRSVIPQLTRDWIRGIVIIVHVW